MTASDSSSSSSDNNTTGGDLKKSRNRLQHEQTLYDLLGASPKDSTQVLKTRYTALVRRLHPDAQTNNKMYFADNEKDFHFAELNEINAAWQILSDPKARRKYDRDLAAKEFAQGVETFVEFGIQTAIPWFQKTADQTAQAVEQSTLVVSENTQRAKQAYNVFELGQTAKQLERSAAAELAKAQKLRVQAEKVVNNNKRNKKKGILVAPFSSTDVTRIIQKWQQVTATPLLNKELTNLKKVETQYNQGTTKFQTAEQNRLWAERQVDLATQTQLLAQEQLVQAQQALAEAQLNLGVAQKEETVAIQQAKQAQLAVDKLVLQQEKAQDKIINQIQALEQKEQQLTSRKLQQQALEFEQAAQDLQRRAQELKNNSQ